MNPSENLLALVARGHEIMARERALLMRGEFDEVARLSDDKRGLLGALEAAIREARGTESVRRALAALIADSRRNERLLAAARQGVAAARRRIDAIIATGRGAVAYNRDGSVIASRDDATQKSKTA